MSAGTTAEFGGEMQNMAVLVGVRMRVEKVMMILSLAANRWYLFILGARSLANR